MMKNLAKDLLDCLQYEEALPIFDAIFNMEKKTLTKDDYIDYIRCLRMCNKNEKALQICRELYNRKELYENDPTFNSHNQLYAAILYDCYISNFETWSIKDEDRFLSTVDQILSIVNQNQSFFYESAVFKALEYLSSKVIKDVRKMYDYLKKVDPNKLSDEILTYIDINGHCIELGANKSKWELYNKILSENLKN